MFASFQSAFSGLEDPRVERHKLHQLDDILFLTVSAALCGAEGWEAIEHFGEEKLDWLRTYVPLANNVPSHDCIARVISRLSAESLMQCFITWTKTILGEVQGEIIAIDGKTVRRSYDKKQGLESIHMVNAWATQAGLALGQVKTDAKSNEITAIPQLIALLELKGQIVSIDAMGCQTAIAQAIVKKQADYVLAVKDNQKQLHESIVDFFDTLRKNDTDTAQWHEQTDAGHGRIEVRRYVQSACLLSLPNVERWQKLTTIGMVESQRMVGEKTSCERRYYVSSLPLDVVQFAKVVRSHWGIENSLHWVLDVTMREDNSRLRRENAACNFAVVRQVVLNLLKKEPSKSSIKRKQFRASLSDSFRHHIIQNSAK